MTYHGRKLEDMTREELIEVLRDLVASWDRAKQVHENTVAFYTHVLKSKRGKTDERAS